MNNVILFGELLLRLASPGNSRFFQKDSFDTSFCGGEANVAVSLSLLGVDAKFVTVLPYNDIGIAGKRTLDYYGVDTSNIIFREGRMGTYYLEKGASQRSSKVIYDRKYSSFSLARINDFDWNRIFDGSDWFHLTGITPSLSEELSKICIFACQEAKKRGLMISCDLNYRAKLWPPKKAQEVMRKIMPFVDICIANEEDAEKSLGFSSYGSDIKKGIINIDGYKETAQKICKQFGCKYVAITLRESYSASRNGWSAILYSSISDEVCISQKYDIQLVDRVGGGDSFAAGIIYGFLKEKEPHNILNFAVAASCLKQTIEGDFNRVSVEEIESLLLYGGNGRVKR